MTNIPTSAVLDAAADTIQMAGWTKGTRGWTGENDGALCLEGAIGAVMGEEFFFPDNEATRRAGMAGALNVSRLERTCPAFEAVRKYLGVRPYVFNDVAGLPTR